MPDSNDQTPAAPEYPVPAGAADGTEAEPPRLQQVTLDAPQFQVAAAHPKRVELGIAALFMLALAGFAAFGGAFWVNASNFWLGATLGVGLSALGVGMVAWGKYLMPRGPFSESRHLMTATEDDRELFLQDFSSRGKVAIERRSFLIKILGAAGGVFGIVAVFPLVRSLGPLPKKLFYTTAWRKGSYLVTADGTRVRVDHVERGGVLTVFPESDPGGALSQTLLVRLRSSGNIVTAPGREDWGPDGYLAFSKVCTHAGCPVALYLKKQDELLCPCHQSTFEIGDGRPALPTFGPAPRPLPQLPLRVDSAGYLRARNGYSEPVGPGFWERGNQ
jgi:ubiquinol-cytochrome c reductase iron-sulfur subunit